MIRELVRRNDLGWRAMVLLALCLALAEEFLIQQTSLAPLVVRIQGVEYARAFGLNYVYLLWALVYEVVLVVLLPIMLTEMLFPSRRHARWLSRGGWIAHVLLFALACPLAWYGWTRQARVHQFGLPAYDPPLFQLAAAAVVIGLLMVAALGLRDKAPRPLPLPHPMLLALGGAIWAVLWFAVELFAFGAFPATPPAAVVAGGLGFVVLMLALMPRFAANPGWSDRHRAWLVTGTMIATMLIFFRAGFDPVTAPLDFWFKAVVDTIASALFVLLLVKVSRRPAAGAQPRS